jgi:hypothetical protein
MAAFTVIDHEELTGAAATWTSATIPSSYDHLYLTISARGALAGSNWYEYVDVQLNGDTGTNYSSTGVYGQASAGSWRTSGADGLDRVLLINADGSTADTFGNASIWIPNYANTANFKQVVTKFVTEGATDTNGHWTLGMGAGLWQSTAAITSITIDPQNGDLMQYSSFTLYGVTGA